jgi:hypothetical protein
MRGCALVIALAQWHALTSEALRHGEHVHTTKRSQFNEVRPRASLLRISFVQSSSPIFHLLAHPLCVSLCLSVVVWACLSFFM